MVICAAADIHYPRQGHRWSASLAGQMCDAGADAIVLAGDIATGGGELHHRFLRLFARFDGLKLLVPGNHDLWADGLPPDTHRRYREHLREIADDSGFRYLPDQPVVSGNVGFVGAAGWYDYSFRQLRPPVTGLRVTPLVARRMATGAAASPLPGRADLPWEDLTDTDYAAKGLSWCHGARTQSLAWNDALYIDWGAADADVVAAHCADLARDIAAIGAAASQLVGVCHLVPCEELLGGPTEDVAFAYCRAYMGSARLGDTLAADPRTRLILCGHAHSRRVIERGNVVFANCSVGDRNAGPLVFALPAVSPPQACDAQPSPS